MQPAWEEITDEADWLNIVRVRNLLNPKQLLCEVVAPDANQVDP